MQKLKRFLHTKGFLKVTDQRPIHTKIHIVRMHERGIYECFFGAEDSLQLLQTVADSSRYENTSICDTFQACSKL